MNTFLKTSSKMNECTIKSILFFIEISCGGEILYGEKDNINFQVYQLRLDLGNYQKYSQRAESRPKRSAMLLKVGSNMIDNKEKTGLKCYPCQKSSLFITKEVSRSHNLRL